MPKKHRFKDGMAKYRNRYLAVSDYYLDGNKEKCNETMKNNKLNHAEKLVTAPIRFLTEPAIGLVLLAGGVLVGGLCLPIGLVFSSRLAKIGGAALAGGSVMGLGALASCVDIIITTPYDAVKAFQHRHHDCNQITETNPAEVNAPNPTNGNSFSSTSSTQILSELGSNQIELNAQRNPPSQPDFLASTFPAVPLQKTYFLPEKERPSGSGGGQFNDLLSEYPHP